MPLIPESRKEAEIRLRVLTTIEAHQDRCPTTTIREGALHGNDTAFERLLGESGILMRTAMVHVVVEGNIAYYGRTEHGRKMQEFLKLALSLDDFTRGEGWKK